MNDPWAEFAAQAPSAESAAYFETAGTLPGRPGSAVFTTRPANILTVDRHGDLDGLERESAELLRGRRDAALVGYLGFDAASIFDPLFETPPSGSPFPLGEFALVEKVRRRPVPNLARRRTRGRVTEVRTRRQALASLSRPRFQQAVRDLHSAIGGGDAFQVVLANRHSWERPLDLVDRAGDLRASERFAYFCYLKFGEREFVAATPESMLVVRGRRAFIDPIAGTRPLPTASSGRLPLHRDPKELAEHRMLVDLARNDLGRVARPGTVRVISLERPVRLARVEHLVSRVGARLCDGVGPWMALSAAFPAGTVSGAPKIRATALLRQAEATWRGPYGGAVGLLRGDGEADWALGIRMGFATGHRLFTQAGAGVVWASRPSREYGETEAKLAQVESTLVGSAR